MTKRSTLPVFVIDDLHVWAAYVERANRAVLENLKYGDVDTGAYRNHRVVIGYSVSQAAGLNELAQTGYLELNPTDWIAQPEKPPLKLFARVSNVPSP